MNVILGVLPLLVALGLVVLAVTAVRRRAAAHGTAGAPGAGAQEVRRFFQYAILYALVVIAAAGLTGLLGRLGEPRAASGDAAFATSLALAAVGTPLALTLGAWTRRMHARDPQERRSVMWFLHVVLGAITGLIGSMVGLVGTLEMAFGVTRPRAEAPGSLLVWGAVWLAYWLLGRRTLAPHTNEFHLLLGSLAGLVTAMVGMVGLMAAAIEALTRPAPDLGATIPLGTGAAVLATGAVVWVWYWIRHAAHLERGPLWFVYVLPLGVGGGLLTALVGGSITLWQVAILLLGDTFGKPAIEVLDSTPTALGAAVTGTAVWWYHTAVLTGSERGRTEVRRVHEYLVAAIGLVAVATGVVVIVAALIEAATPGPAFGMSVRNTLLGAATLLLVGVPVWWVHWSRCQRAAASDPDGELPAPSRRVHLTAVFGIAAVAAIVALIFVAVQVAQDAVARELAAGTLRSIRFGLGILAATAAVAGYHWSVLREDRVHLAERLAVRAGPRRVVLVGAAAPEAVRRALATGGTAVESWGRGDGATHPVDPDDLAGRLAGLRGRDVLVVCEGDGVHVLDVVRPR